MEARNQKDLKRRKFISDASCALAGFMIIPRHVLGGPNYIAPSDKVNVGIVGAGGRGRKNVIELLKLDDVQVSCIADPAAYWDLSGFYYQSSAGRGPVRRMVEKHYEDKGTNHHVSTYEDFKVMLDKESSLDAILCATPDHTHAYISLYGMRAGKHVYCEKPLTHNIWEARMVRQVARETGMATQMGNQLHSTQSIRKAVEYLRAGVIGEVKEIHSWVPASRWLNNYTGLPTGSQPKPVDLNWDLWIGPRSMRPFHEAYAPVTWRDFWEFGCGALGDFGCHDMDAATWGLDLPAPSTIEVRPAGQHNEHITPYGEIGYYEFPENGVHPARKLTWYSGGLRPGRPDILPRDFQFSGRGAMYIGEKGIMVTGGGGLPSVFSESTSASLTKAPESLPPTNGHHRDWIDAIKGGPAASSNFDYAAHLTELTLLGVLSLRLGGQKIYWDAEQMKAVGNDEADAIIEEPVREGWEMK